MNMTRATFLTLCATLPLTLFGCSNTPQDTSGGTSSPESHKVTVGSLPTEDILPLWVAQQEGLFQKHGVECAVQTFQSATELIAAVSSGQVDLAMTDPMVSASLYASGADVRIVWVTLGTDASQGRFGIMSAPDSGIQTLQDLAGVEVGVGSNTILEYVMDTLLLDAGVPEDQIEKAELQKLPVRYEAMASGQVKAAALPGTLLALGEASGMRLVADDTAGKNISQSVMIAREDFARGGGHDALDAVRAAWDDAVGLLNTSPEEYRALLVEKASLPEAIAQTYPISTYPKAQLPEQRDVDDVLAWMKHKGYLDEAVGYDAQTGTFTGR